MILDALIGRIYGIHFTYRKMDRFFLNNYQIQRLFTPFGMMALKDAGLGERKKPKRNLSF